MLYSSSSLGEKRESIRCPNAQEQTAPRSIRVSTNMVSQLTQQPLTPNYVCRDQCPRISNSESGRACIFWWRGQRNASKARTKGSRTTWLSSTWAATQNRRKTQEHRDAIHGRQQVILYCELSDMYRYRLKRLACLLEPLV